MSHFLYENWGINLFNYFKVFTFFFSPLVLGYYGENYKKGLLILYFARLYFSKVVRNLLLVCLDYVQFSFMLHQGICYLQPRKNDILSVDAHPSDAINVANRCKVYIFHKLVLHLVQVNFVQ